MSQSPSFPIPALGAGIGLKPDHYNEALTTAHDLDFFEVHAENFMRPGGPPHRWLGGFRAQYPLSIHGVCLSVGGRDPLDAEHLARLADLVARYEPALVSEHLAWSSDGAFCFNDLLPPPLTARSLARICEHVDQIQSALNRTILIENPSAYLQIAPAEIPEPAFLNEIADRTGCGILLDINNVYVSAFNIGFDANAYVDAIDAATVGEIHLAGHAIDRFEDITIRVDNHGEPICTDVFELFARFLRRAGPRPTLIERDTNLPAFDVLVAEAGRARDGMRRAMNMSDAYDAA